MKLFFVYLLTILSTQSNAQIPKAGVYTYDWCDIEYNKWLGKCKIKIKGKKIWVYAPANLSGIKESDLYESGTLHKHASGKWIIINPKDNMSKKMEGSDETIAWINFKRKQFWTF